MPRTSDFAFFTHAQVSGRVDKINAGRILPDSKTDGLNAFLYFYFININPVLCKIFHKTGLMCR